MAIFPEALAFLDEASAILPEASDFLDEALATFAEAFAFLAEGSAFVAPCSAQNMAARPPPHPNARRIATPAVRAKILAVIGRMLQPAERDDVMQKTYVRLFVIIDRLPESDEDLIGFVGGITHGLVINQLRSNSVRDRRLGEESEAADVEEPAEAVTPQQRLEWKALHEVADQAVKDGAVPPEALVWAERLARGDTYAHIGDDEGLPEATVRKRMERFRKILRSRWTQATGITGAVIGALLLYFGLRHPATPNIVPEAYVPVPTVTSAPAEETPAQKVARLTSQAQALCDRLDFEACEARLNDASDIDRDNESRPAVVKMRHAIQNANGKPQRLKP